MDITQSIYWGADYGEELVIPREEVVSLQDLVRLSELLLERSGAKCLRSME